MKRKIRNFLYTEILCLSMIAALIFSLGFFSKPSFDDMFMKNNGLFPYVDFRPGYPPLGKLPYYFFTLTLGENIYGAGIFIFNLLTLFVMCLVFYLNILKLEPKRASLLALAILFMPSVLYLTLVYSHADALALIFTLLSLYFIDKPWIAGAMCGIGTLVKFHPVILLIPLLTYLNGLKRKVSLLYSFSLVLLLFSLPFLLVDPLMYISSFTNHFSRGPSESIFAIIDGYYGHTGFLHPTFDATIYSWQYAAIYTPSPRDHFSYKWNIPILPYLSTALQVVFLVTLSFIAKKRKDQKESLMLISLGVFSYFALSSFYNPIIHMVQILLLILATLNWKKSLQITVIGIFEIINLIHSLVWFSPMFLGMGGQLPLSIAIILRTTSYGMVFLIFVMRRKI